DSMTMSTPSSPQGSAAGSRSSKTLMALPPTVMTSPSYETSTPSGPPTESYFSRWASAALSVRSFTATISRSAFCARAARRKFRPIRPKPLIPILTDTKVSWFLIKEVRKIRGLHGQRRPDGQNAHQDAHLLRQYQQTGGLLACCFKPLSDVLPVRDVPRRLDVVRLDVQVVQVEGVLPHVQLEQRDGAHRGVRVLIEHLLDDQAGADRVPAENGPPGALDAHGCRGEVRLELLERAEELLDRRRELAFRLTAAVRREVGPEDRVVDV